MRRLIFLFLITIYVSAFLSCAHHHRHAKIPDKDGPEWVGVDPKLQMYVDAYKDLAASHNIHFHHQVTVGLKTIGTPPVIGLCWNQDGWREIDIDKGFFDRVPEDQKMILLYHELTHCYCGRDHDYPGGKYEDSMSSFFDLTFQPPFISIKSKGYFPDGCGISIMTPEIESEECINDHINSYLNEMFERCKPY